MRQFYKIDKDGYYVEPISIPDNIEVPLDCVKNPPIDGLYRAFWNGELWVEGLSAEEIEKINATPKEPSEIEKLRLEQAQANAELFEMVLMLTGGGG